MAEAEGQGEEGAVDILMTREKAGIDQSTKPEEDVVAAVVEIEGRLVGKLTKTH